MEGILSIIGRNWKILNKIKIKIKDVLDELYLKLFLYIFVKNDWEMELLELFRFKIKGL